MTRRGYKRIVIDLDWECYQLPNGSQVWRCNVAGGVFVAMLIPGFNAWRLGYMSGAQFPNQIVDVDRDGKLAAPDAGHAPMLANKEECFALAKKCVGVYAAKAGMRIPPLD